MSLHLGATAPDFTQQSTEGEIRFHEWIGVSWAILFSHPKDFTPVCTTELGTVAKIKQEFEQRHCKVVGLSVDPLTSHQGWIKDIERTQDCRMNFPVIADADRSVAKLYDMIHPEANDTFTVRSVFFIDPQKKIRASLTYPASTGRNFAELLRVLDSLQLTDQYSVATPANWKDGDEVVISPKITDKAEIAKKFPKGHRELTPYLRMTPQPNR